MDSFDDDMFALSDEELPLETISTNPIEEYLMKQLSSIQHRIEQTSNDINEVEDTTKHILEALYYEARYGERLISDSDGDLYTIDGEPVIKRSKDDAPKPKEILIVRNNWKYIVYDKWVIGIVLLNTSKKSLSNIEIYATIDGLDEIDGSSMFWSFTNGMFWNRTNIVQPGQEIVATVVFDLPKFDEDSFYEAYGTIAYETDLCTRQTPTPVISLCVEETVDKSCELNFESNASYSILALKSTSFEKIVRIAIKEHPQRGERILRFLEEKSFKEIFADVYLAKTTGSLMYCLIEILPIIEEHARLRIFSRSVQQMGIILRLLKDKFPDLIVEDEDNVLHAAKMLIEEMELYLRDANPVERLIASLKTDLLIS